MPWRSGEGGYDSHLTSTLTAPQSVDYATVTDGTGAFYPADLETAPSGRSGLGALIGEQTTWSENFEGGTNGANITGTNTVFTTGGLGTFNPTFDGTDPIAGSLSMRVNVGSGQTSFAQLAGIGPFTVLYQRVLLSLDNGWPTGGTVTLLVARGTAAPRAQVGLNTSGQLEVRDGASTLVYTSPALPSSGDVRLEWRVDADNSQQQIQVFYGANVTGTTPDIDSGNQTYSMPSIDATRVGAVINTSGVWSALFDEYAARTDGWCGPVASLNLPVNVGLADTGSGTDDNLTVAATATLADAGLGDGVLTVAAAVPLADAGSGADVLSATAAVPLAETGNAAESLTAAATLSLTDTGTSADVLSVTVSVALSDTGSGSDALTVAPSIALADTGNTAEALTANVTAALAETGSFADSLNVDKGGTPVALADVGSSTDALAVTVSAPVADSGTALDALTVGAAVALVDQASAVDAFAAAVSAVFAEVAAFTDALTVDKSGGALNAGPDQTYVVGRELRSVTVGAEARVLAVLRETRTERVAAEQRTERIPAEDRTVRR